MRGLLALVLILAAGCGGDGGPAGPDGRAYTGLLDGASWSYDVTAPAVLPGQVKLARVDPAYRDGVDALRTELWANSNLVATRWLQVTDDALWLLGEEVRQADGLVERKYTDPIKLLPIPLEPTPGYPVLTWTTSSAVVGGGSVTHRIDNAGKGTLVVPAGSFEAYHLVHTVTDEAQIAVEYDEYFVPERWLVQFEFEYPAGSLWKATN